MTSDRGPPTRSGFAKGSAPHALRGFRRKTAKEIADGHGHGVLPNLLVKA